MTPFGYCAGGFWGKPAVTVTATVKTGAHIPTARITTNKEGARPRPYPAEARLKKEQAK